MEITIVGASAGVGLLAVQQVLAQGHYVTTLSRTVATLLDHSQLTKVAGSATTVADLRRVLPGAEAVLITVGTAKKNVTPLFTETARALLEATADAPLAAPVLVLTGFGASAPYLSWWMRLAIRWFMQPEYDNKTKLEELVAASSLHWEVVRPGMLTNGPLAPYRVLPDLTPGMEINSISRASVADFLLRQAQRPTLLYRYPALTS